MQRPSGAERQSRVRSIANDRSTEPEIVLAVLNEELPQALPCFVVGSWRVGVEHFDEEAPVEGRAEHRGPPHERTVGRGKASIRAIAAVSIDSGSIAPEATTWTRSSAN